MTNSELVLAIALDVSKAKNEDQQTVKLLYWVDMIKMLGAKEALVERAAQCIAHRACCGSEHDPLHGKLHGYCVVCGVPWPCEYVGPLPVVAAKAEPVPVPTPEPEPHEHDRAFIARGDAGATETCECGATRFWWRAAGGLVHTSWVEPAPAVDESEPPIGYSVVESFPGSGCWRWQKDDAIDVDRLYFCDRPEAVALCWAHSRGPK